MERLHCGQPKGMIMNVFYTSSTVSTTIPITAAITAYAIHIHGQFPAYYINSSHEISISKLKNGTSFKG